MALDPRTPVVVGVGQSVRRPSVDELEGVAEPAEMMADVLRLAADGRLLAAADSVRVVESVSWPYANPALAVAERVGASPRDTVRTTTGGNSPQMLVNDTAAAITRGELDVALIVGAEAVYTRNLARRTKTWLPWSVQPDDVPVPRRMGVDLPGNNDMESDRGVLLPTQVYAMFENVLRAEAGESIDEHRKRVAALWAGFSAVAARNPYAWSPEERTADEIATVTADNRMVCFPYPKLMNANIQTDQAAGLVLCSVEAARSFGVPEDRWVFPWMGGDAHDTWFVSERESLTASVPLRRFEVPADDIAHVDIYSCFPSAVQIAARELGFGLDRQLTVTGGLTFAGGPANNYVTHSIATMVEVLRADPGSLGLVTAVGWYLTKHAVGIYSTAPPPDGFRHVVLDDAVPTRGAVASYEGEGEVEVEAYTVMFDREGAPETGLYSLRLPDGRRAWGRSGPVDVGEELCGRRARLAPDGTVTLP